MNKFTLNYIDQEVTKRFYEFKLQFIKPVYKYVNIVAFIQFLAIISQSVGKGIIDDTKGWIIMGYSTIFIAAIIGYKFSKYLPYIFFVESVVIILVTPVLSQEGVKALYDNDVMYGYHFAAIQYLFMELQQESSLQWYWKGIFMFYVQVLFQAVNDIKIFSSPTITIVIFNIAFTLVAYSNQKQTKKIYLEDLVYEDNIQQLIRTLEKRIPCPIAVVSIKDIEKNNSKKQEDEQNNNNTEDGCILNIDAIQIKFKNMQFSSEFSNQNSNIFNCQVYKLGSLNKINDMQNNNNTNINCKEENKSKNQVTLFEKMFEYYKEIRDIQYRTSFYSIHLQNQQSKPGKSYQIYVDQVPYIVSINQCEWDQDKNSILLVFDNMAEQQKQYEVEKLKEMSQFKDHILESISHDLRTPLISIQSHIELVIKQCIDNQELMENAQICEKNCQMLGLLINDILDYSRLHNAQSIRLRGEYFYVKDLVQEVIDLQEVQAQFKGIKLIQECDFNQSVNYSSKFPNYLTNRDCEVFSDKLKLKQILTNLVSNAVKFTFEGYVQIMAKTVVVNEQQCVLFEVKDTGIGIKDQFIPHLFKLYNTFSDQRQKNENGIGLGLAISKKLVGFLGPFKDIKLETEYQKGSVFSFYIYQNLNLEEIDNVSIIHSKSIQFHRNSSNLFLQQQQQNNNNGLQFSSNIFENLSTQSQIFGDGNNTNNNIGNLQSSYSTIKNNKNNNLNFKNQLLQGELDIIQSVYEFSQKSSIMNNSAQNQSHFLQSQRGTIYQKNNNNSQNNNVDQECEVVGNMGEIFQEENIVVNILQDIESIGGSYFRDRNVSGGVGFISENSKEIQEKQKQQQLQQVEIKEEKQKVSFLLVDDVAFNNISLEKIIQNCLGKEYLIRIEFCSHGQQVLDKIQKFWKEEKFRFDIIVMDINMPIMDGITACKEILKMQNEGKIPKQNIWISTANSNEKQVEDVHKGIQVNRIVPKPIKADLLIRYVKQTVQEEEERTNNSNSNKQQNSRNSS